MHSTQGRETLLSCRCYEPRRAHFVLQVWATTGQHTIVPGPTDPRQFALSQLNLSTSRMDWQPFGRAMAADVSERPSAKLTSTSRRHYSGDAAKRRGPGR